MAWMNDYEYDFVQDSIDKKITARSARNMRTHNGKRGTVRLPSDNLTKKELKAMSGECVKYSSLKKPMSWEEFKALPDDLKKEYILKIREQFGAPDRYIGEMFGVSGATMGLYSRDLGIGLGKEASGGNRKWKKEEFYAWISGADLNAPVLPVVTAASDETSESSSSLSDNGDMTVPHDPAHFIGNCIPVIPKSGSITFENNRVDDILQTIKVLLSDVRVNCTITWNCVFEEGCSCGE